MYIGDTVAYAYGVALQDDKIVAAGTAGSPADVVVVRLKPDGYPDGGFGASANGRVLTDFGGQDRAFGMAIYPSGVRAGRIVTAGHGSPTGDFALARFLAS